MQSAIHTTPNTSPSASSADRSEAQTRVKALPPSLDVSAGGEPLRGFVLSGLQPENTLFEIEQRPEPGADPAVQEYCLSQTVEGARFTLRSRFSRGTCVEARQVIEWEQVVPRKQGLVLDGSLSVLDDRVFLEQQQLMTFRFHAEDHSPARQRALSFLTQRLHEHFMDKGAVGVYETLEGYLAEYGEDADGAVHVYQHMQQVMELQHELHAQPPQRGWTDRPAEPERTAIPELPASIAQAEEASALIAEICQQEYAAHLLRHEPELLAEQCACPRDFEDSLAPRVLRQKLGARPLIDLIAYSGEDRPHADLWLHVRLRQRSDDGGQSVEIEKMSLSIPTPIPFVRAHLAVPAREKVYVSAYGVDHSFFQRLFRALHESNLPEERGRPEDSEVYRFLANELGTPRPAGMVATLRQLLGGS